ncbi:MAG: GNAT family N-acetyltransferase [Chloroflexi bacterium]|nr:GNAT family N-acetyltransferase [Chloroflexota bacterium]
MDAAVGDARLNIEGLQPSDERAIEQCARILIDAFRGHTESWPDMDTALAEVREDLTNGVITRIARGPDGNIAGWIGAIEQYDGHVWEIHPVAVAPQHQRQGLGRALLADIEALAAQRGVITLWLGTDDEDGRTSLGGVNPYPDPLTALAAIQNIGGHPFEFYQRCGFVLVGMLPDANGPGRPDIYMAKRVSPAR